jgi:putative phosphoesterase
VPQPKKLLVISDTHIPERADEVPPEMAELIDRERPYDVVVHAGDLVSEAILAWTRSLARRTYVVQGNMDYLNLPSYEVFEVEGVRIGVVHGHQVRPRGNVEALTRIAERLRVKILISGHTHAATVKTHGGVVHVNPGSLTGVWGGGGGSMRPSLAFIVVESGRVSVSVYELVGGEPRRTMVLGPLSLGEDAD